MKRSGTACAADCMCSCMRVNLNHQFVCGGCSAINNAATACAASFDPSSEGLRFLMSCSSSRSGIFVAMDLHVAMNFASTAYAAD